MQSRLKVSDFYQEIKPNCAISIPRLSKAFFDGQLLFATTQHQPYVLMQYSLKNKQLIQTHNLPLSGLRDVKTINNLICCIFQDNQHLWILQDHKFIHLESHFAPITSLALYKGNLLSGSEDMTIRVWNPCSSGLTQDSKLHIMNAHTGKINCLHSNQNLLLSGSADKKLIAWKGTTVWASKLFQSQIKIITECPESNQYAVVAASGQISILNAFLIAKQKKIEMSRVLKGVNSSLVIGLNEIDDSFMQIVSENTLQIAQINIGEVMATVKVAEKKILAVKCLRRMTLCAIEQNGLYSFNF